MGDRSVLPLSQLEVLVIDCQATAAAPRGHLLEIAWVLPASLPTPSSRYGRGVGPTGTACSEPTMGDGPGGQSAWRAG